MIMVNPISGRTRRQEIAIAGGIAGIGGRLPFNTYCDLLRRGIRKKIKRRTSARRNSHIEENDNE